MRLMGQYNARLTLSPCLHVKWKTIPDWPFCLVCMSNRWPSVITAIAEHPATLYLHLIDQSCGVLCNPFTWFSSVTSLYEYLPVYTLMTIDFDTYNIFNYWKCCGSNFCLSLEIDEMNVLIKKASNQAEHNTDVSIYLKLKVN